MPQMPQDMTAPAFDALADLSLLEEARSRYKFDDAALRKALGVTDKNAFRQWRHRNAVPLDIRPKLLVIVAVVGATPQEAQLTHALNLMGATVAWVELHLSQGRPASSRPRRRRRPARGTPPRQ
jgi:hypothetical protein